MLKEQPRVFDNRELEFSLRRNNDNRGMWARLLGSPWDSTNRTATIGLEIDGKPLRYRTIADGKAADEIGDPNNMEVVLYDSRYMAAGLIGLLLVVGGSIWLAFWKGMIRDPKAIPQMRSEDCTFSLGRLQMQIWSCLVIGSFVFIFLVTWDLNSITAESFILLGISASTAMASVAIERSKSGGTPLPDADPIKVSKAVEALGLKTQGDVETLFDPANDTKDADKVIAGAPAGLKVEQLREQYKAAIKPFGTANFFSDLVNDTNGPTIHRWQILAWTFVLALIYIISVYTSLEAPGFGNNLLALMGISGGTYLGFKIAEKPAG